MKGSSCGMSVTEKPFREAVEGEAHYCYCLGCLEADRCRRDRPPRCR